MLLNVQDYEIFVKLYRDIVLKHHCPSIIFHIQKLVYKWVLAPFVESIEEKIIDLWKSEFISKSIHDKLHVDLYIVLRINKKLATIDLYGLEQACHWWDGYDALDLYRCNTSANIYRSNPSLNWCIWSDLTLWSIVSRILERSQWF